MSDPRTTWSLADETAEKLEAAADRKPDESTNEFLRRVAAMLDGTEIRTDVTKPNAEQSGDLLTTDEFEARLDDLAAQLPQRTADELETRFR